MLHAIFQSKAELAALIFQMMALAVVLVAVGYFVRKLATNALESRRAAKLRAEALVAGTRARAQARLAARTAQEKAIF